MVDSIEQVIADMKILYKDVADDTTNGYHMAYKEHLQEYNTLIERLHLLNLLTEESMIETVPAGQRAPGRLASSVEEIKSLEIRDKLRMLIRKTNTYVNSSNELEDCDGVLNKIFDRFHWVVRQLRDRYNTRPTLEVEDEYDVQDLLHCLLKIDFDDIRAEEHTPSYAGGTKRMDFLLKNEKTVIEVKKTRKGLGDKEIGEQLLIDIATYSAHSDCKNLYCFVYDPEGRIGNATGLINDIEKKSTETLRVRLFIKPS